MTSMPLPIDPAHPAFEGHFPSRPIVPGVVLLDHGLRAIDAQRDATVPAGACRIGTAKFLSFVRPGEPVRVELEHVATAATTATTKDDWRLRIYAGRPDDERLAMTGNVSFDRADRATGAALGTSA